MVSAWANKARAVFGQMAVDEKTNEITAVPELLELLDIEGTIITADAMSCQKEIVRKIREKGADYVIRFIIGRCGGVFGGGQKPLGC